MSHEAGLPVMIGVPDKTGTKGIYSTAGLVTGGSACSRQANASLYPSDLALGAP